MWIVFYWEAAIKSLEIAKECFRVVNDKKAQDPVVLKLKGLTNITDYFVVCHGTSQRHIKTIADSIVQALTEKGVYALHYEADAGFNWIVVDYVDAIVHIFSEEKRHYYRLEQLWGDAKRVLPRQVKS